VVLCDVMLTGRDDGFRLLAAHHAEARFVMYSAFDFPAHHVRAIDEGAAGYVSKMADADEIARAIRRVAAGGVAFGPEVLASARQAPRPPTPRERQVLELLVDGASNDEMARGLGIRVKTIEGTIRRLFDRYSVENRTQLARYALRQGWLTSGPTENARDSDGVGSPV
jgi:two-component system response regulator DesR